MIFLSSHFIPDSDSHSEAMLSAEEAQSHGKTVNKLIESLLGCDDSALTVETTMELLNSMKVRGPGVIIRVLSVFCLFYSVILSET